MNRSASMLSVNLKKSSLLFWWWIFEYMTIVGNLNLKIHHKCKTIGIKIEITIHGFDIFNESGKNFIIVWNIQIPNRNKCAVPHSQHVELMEINKCHRLIPFNDQCYQIK